MKKAIHPPKKLKPIPSPSPSHTLVVKKSSSSIQEITKPLTHPSAIPTPKKSIKLTPPLPIEENTPSLPTPQSFKSREGHEVRFIQQPDQTWLANVQENLPLGFQRELTLPIYASPGLAVENILSLPTEKPIRQLQVILPERGPQGKGYAYLGPTGLLGGGNDNNHPKYVSCRDCGSRAPVVEVKTRKTGSFLWIDFVRDTYIYQCGDCEYRAQEQANREARQRQWEAEQRQREAEERALQARIQKEQAAREAQQRQREATYQRKKATIDLQLKRNEDLTRQIEKEIGENLAEEKANNIRADESLALKKSLLERELILLESQGASSKVIQELEDKIEVLTKRLIDQHASDTQDSQIEREKKALDLRNAASAKNAHLMAQLTALHQERYNLQNTHNRDQQAEAEWKAENARKTCQETKRLNEARRAAAAAREVAEEAKKAADEARRVAEETKKDAEEGRRAIAEARKAYQAKAAKKKVGFWEKNWNGLKKGCKAAWEGVKTAAKAAWKGTKTVAKAAWEGTKTVVKAVGKGLQHGLGATIKGIKWVGQKAGEGAVWAGKQVVKAAKWAWEHKKELLIGGVIVGAITAIILCTGGAGATLGGITKGISGTSGFTWLKSLAVNLGESGLAWLKSLAGNLGKIGLEAGKFLLTTKPGKAMTGGIIGGVASLLTEFMNRPSKDSTISDQQSVLNKSFTPVSSSNPTTTTPSTHPSTSPKDKSPGPETTPNKSESSISAKTRPKVTPGPQPSPNKASSSSSTPHNQQLPTKKVTIPQPINEPITPKLPSNNKPSFPTTKGTPPNHPKMAQPTPHQSSPDSNASRNQQKRKPNKKGPFKQFPPLKNNQPKKQKKQRATSPAPVKQAPIPKPSPSTNPQKPTAPSPATPSSTSLPTIDEEDLPNAPLPSPPANLSASPSIDIEQLKQTVLSAIQELFPPVPPTPAQIELQKQTDAIQGQAQAVDKLVQDHQQHGPQPALKATAKQLTKDLNKLTEEVATNHNLLNELANDPTNSKKLQKHLQQRLEHTETNLNTLESAQEELASQPDLQPAPTPTNYQEASQAINDCLSQPEGLVELASEAVQKVDNLLQGLGIKVNPSPSASKKLLEKNKEAEVLNQVLKDLLGHLHKQSDKLMREKNHANLPALSHSIETIQQSLNKLSRNFDIPKTTPDTSINQLIDKGTVQKAVELVLDTTVPGSELVKVLLGLRPSPKDVNECLQLAAETALDFIPGGKILKALKGAGGKLALAKIKKTIKSKALSKAEKLGKASKKSEISQLNKAVFKNGYYEVNGLKFSEYYYNKLWNTGRGAPSLVAKEVLEEGVKSAVPHEIKSGFNKYIYGCWEMIYNPTTKEV